MYPCCSKKAFQSNANGPLSESMAFIANKVKHVQGSLCIEVQVWSCLEGGWGGEHGQSLVQRGMLGLGPVQDGDPIDRITDRHGWKITSLQLYWRAVKVYSRTWESPFFICRSHSHWTCCTCTEHRSDMIIVFQVDLPWPSPSFLSNNWKISIDLSMLTLCRENFIKN